MVVNADKLSSLEVERIKKSMGVERVFVNGRLNKYFSIDFHLDYFLKVNLEYNGQHKHLLYCHYKMGNQVF